MKDFCESECLSESLLRVPGTKYINIIRRKCVCLRYFHQRCFYTFLYFYLTPSTTISMRVRGSESKTRNQKEVLELCHSIYTYRVHTEYENRFLISPLLVLRGSVFFFFSCWFSQRRLLFNYYFLYYCLLLSDVWNLWICCK